MSRRNRNEQAENVDVSDVDVGSMPSRARLAIISTFGGGPIGLFVGFAVFLVTMWLFFVFIDFVRWLDIPVISYVFSPEFLEYPMGVAAFGFVLFLCLVAMLAIFFGVVVLFDVLRQRFF